MSKGSTRLIFSEAGNMYYMYYKYEIYVKSLCPMSYLPIISSSWWHRGDQCLLSRELTFRIEFTLFMIICRKLEHWLQIYCWTFFWSEYRSYGRLSASAQQSGPRFFRHGNRRFTSSHYHSKTSQKYSQYLCLEPGLVNPRDPKWGRQRGDTLYLERVWTWT